MDKFFYPKSIGIIGASDHPRNLGKIIIQNLINFDFPGRWHAIGHRPGKLFAQPVYPSILDVPDEIDLAVILTRPEDVSEVAKSCGQKGIKRLVVSTAGFSEYSQQGSVLENDLLEICKRHGIRLIGPNCLAVMNMETGLCLPFTAQRPGYWEKGPVGVISQSGTVAIHYAKHLSHGKVGVSKVASIGNKLDVDEVDLLKYLLTDPQTRIIFLYLESFSRPRELLALAASSLKPIILQKSNRSTQSHGIARSHTNAVASDDAVTDFALKQAGIIRVRDIDEMLDCVKVALLPRLKGNRLAFMTACGGMAVMGADESQRNGFSLPPLSTEFLNWVESKGRAGIISLTNPMDLGDIYDLDFYIPAMDELLKLSEVDGIFFDFAYSSEFEGYFFYDSLFEYCSRINNNSEKPVYIRVNVSTPEALSFVDERLSAPYFTSMSGAFRGMKKVMNARELPPAAPAPFKKPHAHDDIADIIHAAHLKGKHFLDYEGYDILKALNIPTTRSVYVTRKEVNSAPDLLLHFPVALKAVGPDLIHKTDSNTVCLDLENPEALSKAMKAMVAEAGLDGSNGFLVQEMVEEGIEMLVGGRRDPQFGPVVVVGMGGVLVEILSDSTAAPAPVDMDMAERMVKSLKGYPLLEGFRGSQPADVESLCKIVQRVSDLMAGFPAIESLDLNPVKVLKKGDGSLVLDCKIWISDTHL